jgi:hypothetical protein
MQSNDGRYCIASLSILQSMLCYGRIVLTLDLEAPTSMLVRPRCKVQETLETVMYVNSQSPLKIHLEWKPGFVCVGKRLLHDDKDICTGRIEDAFSIFKFPIARISIISLIDLLILPIKIRRVASKYLQHWV